MSESSAENTTSKTETLSSHNKAERHPFVGVHATLINRGTGEITHLQTDTRTTMAKELSNFPQLEVLCVVKGKKLTIREQKKFNFS